MTTEHDADARSTPTDRDRAVSDPERRPRRAGRGSTTFQTAAVVLTVVVVFTGLVATVPAAAGFSASSPQAVDAGTAPSEAVDASDPVAPPDRPEIDGGFSRSTYTGVAGDPVEVRYTTDGPTYLLIGGNRLSDTGESVGFVDVVKISGTSETTINTRTIGTDASNVESCGLESTSCDLTFVDEDGEPIANGLDNLSEFSGATGAGGLARPLVPQRYRLAITNGTFVVDDSGIVTPTEVADQADLVLEKPSFRDDVEVFTSIDPAALDDDAESESLDALRENGLDRTAVTKGNRIVLGFEATGVWGALSHFAAERGAGPMEAGQPIDHRVLDDLLEEESGVSLRVRQTNPGLNEPRSVLDLSRADPEDVSFIPAEATELQTPDAPGRFYLVIDTSDGDHFTEDPEPGDEFAVEFALEGTEGERYAFAENAEPPAAFNATSETDGSAAQFPYWGIDDGTARAEASFTVRERFLRYDHVTDDGELLVEADEGRLTGTTSLLPVREMSATFVNDAGDAPFRTESSLEIADGKFTVDVDLDGTAAGTRLNYELYEGTTLRDSRTVIVVGDADNPDELVIEEAPENVTVTEGENLSAIRATARNAGGLTGEGDLTLAVDNGSAIGSWGVRLGPGESRSFGFGAVTADLDPGTYPFTLELDGDVHGGTLIVEADPATTTIDDEPAAGNETGGGSDAAGNGTDVDSGGADGAAENGTDGDDAATDDGNGTNSDGADSNDGTTSNGTDGSGAPSDDSPGDGGSQSSGLIPFPFGTREALGGTVLVGAVHLLGHWV